MLKAHRTLPASEIVQAVIKAVTEFAAARPQADDITRWCGSGYMLTTWFKSNCWAKRNAPKTNVSAST